MMLAIPTAADSDDNAAAHDRIYQKPVSDPAAKEFCGEWEEYVHPELRQWFENASTTVEADLQGLLSAENFTIPADHIDAWLNTLNQARLALAARFNVTEADMDRPVSKFMENERDYALFQIHVYGFMQECLIRGIE